MKPFKFNWRVWTGFLLSVLAFVSYFVFFVKFPVTRDFPWANLGLFAIAAVFLVLGIRRGFARGRTHPTRSKIAAGIALALCMMVAGVFVFTIFVAARWLPPSHGAPQVGQKAPEFSLSDSNGKPVSLAELRSAPVNGKAPKGVLLIFYRGYW